MKKFAIISILMACILSVAGCTSGNKLDTTTSSEATTTQHTTVVTTLSTPKDKVAADMYEPEDVDAFTKYCQGNSITLNNFDVEYDMYNNLDKRFTLEGIAELSTYYNYGFDDLEKDYFCLAVQPYDGNYSNRWYIYCYRDSFTEMFNACKKNGSIPVQMVCKIPSYHYESGQNNMALLSVVWY